MANEITTMPGLVDSIMAHIELLKASDDEDTRETGILLSVQVSDLIERAMGTIKLARNQRTAARLEQVELLAEHHELLAAIELCYPGLTRTARLVVTAPRDELKAV